MNVPMFPFFQKLFWATSIVSLIFIGVLLIAIFRSNDKRHPVIIGFLITSWVTAWITLLPLFSDLKDYYQPRPLIHSNVARGPVRTVCNINAVLLAYFWTVVPGYSLAFIIEVLRMLVELITFVNSMNIPDPSTKAADRQLRKGSVDSQASEVSSKEFSSYDDFHWKSNRRYSNETDLETNQSAHSDGSLIRKIKETWVDNWKKIITFLPLISALPSLALVFKSQAQYGWRYVHADEFACYTPDPIVRRYRALVLLCHLASSCILGAIAVVLYLLLRKKTGVGIQRRIHYSLLFRLGALSILSG
ncbi:hypothetical protein O181_033537 [Austropuccinia psidii MF-1]|uniref:Uncharacterized protein n=1 Tax=Austropuccinia psidii MF-1 TaxID=1389203 RepID=A0A9Q3D1K6_9BASI|nr:hypothetical protein [Austropuccinia psidii MF-1]